MTLSTRGQDKINESQLLINENIEKHLAVANTEMGVIKNDISWIKRILWGVVGGIGILLLNILVQVITKTWIK